MNSRRYKTIRIFNEVLEALCKYQYNFISGEWNHFIFARNTEGDRVVVRLNENSNQIIIELDSKHEKETN